jgi:hypothetical protein
MRKSGTQLYRGCHLSSARRWPLAPCPDAGQEKHDESSGRDPGGASETPQLASKEDDEQRGSIDQAEPRAGGGELLPHDTAGHQAVKKPVTVDGRDSIIRTPYNTFHGVSQLLVRSLM